MKLRLFASFGALVLAFVLSGLMSHRLAAQTKPPASAPGQKQAAVHKTPWGDDLQGVWDDKTNTPLERRANVGNRTTLTPEEIAAQDEESADGADRPPRAGDTGTYNAFWFDYGKSDGRTSLITDPADGRMPALTPEAAKRVAALAAARRAHQPLYSWEDASIRERCLVYHAVPFLPTAYNNNVQIVQEPGLVSITTEEIHETRIIPMDGRPHAPANVQQWLGDSRGHWDGNTLVVDTTNFTDVSDIVMTNGIVNHDSNLHIVERYTRVSPTQIEYRFTVEDPTFYSKPWSGMLMMNKNPGLMYEYACHEGNYSLYGMLTGARADDKKAEVANNQPK